LRLLGADGDKVGGKLNFPVLQIDGIGDVHDAPVVRVCCGNREIDSAGEPLVGSRIPEWLAPLDIIVRCDFNSRDASGKGQRNDCRQECERRQATELHGAAA